MNRYALNQERLDTRQTALGHTRPPCWRLSEVRAKLGLSPKALGDLMRRYSIKPSVVHSQGRAFYDLREFKKAINAERGAEVFKIDKDKPLPPKRRANGASSEYVDTAKAMQVGESFTVTDTRSRIASAMGYIGRLGIGKFSYRTHDDPAPRDKVVATIWRVE